MENKCFGKQRKSIEKSQRSMKNLANCSATSEECSDFSALLKTNNEMIKNKNEK